MKIKDILKRSSIFAIIIAGMLVGSISYGAVNTVMRIDKKVVSTNYPKNELGETYGKSIDAKVNEIEPDLISAVGEDGIKGYVRQTELEGEVPKNPEEALAKEAKTDRYINLYKSDGKTIIGKFKVEAPKKHIIQREKND